MYKDPEPELIIQSEDAAEDYPLEPVDLDPLPPLSERLISWMDIVDR